MRYDTKIDKSGFKKGLAEIKKDALKDSADIVSSFNKTAKAIALSAASIGAGIVAVGVKYNAQMEQYNAGFTTMLGSAEKAQKLMGDLKGFAASTPFELTDLANASTTLLAFGEDVGKLMPDLKMLGDISLGNSEKFKGLALVFGQVQSQGRLMGQDLLQMINQGFNPLQIISEKTGKSVATLKDEMAKGQISFEMVADAMKTATTEGGQFYNAMQTQSKTLTGQWSTLKDNVVALTGEISSDISDKLTESVLPALIDKVEELNQMWEDGRLKDYLGTGITLLTAFGAAIVSLNIALFANDLLNITSGVKGFTAATKAGTTAQKLLNAELLKNPATIALVAITTLTAALITYAATHKTAAKEFADSLNAVREEVDEINNSYLEEVKAIEETQRAQVAEASVARSLRDELFSLDEQLKNGKLTEEEACATREQFNAAASQLEKIIPGITSSIYNETGAIDLQRNSIQKLTDDYYNLAIAKATANAYQAELESTLQKKINLETQRDNIKSDFDKKQKEIETGEENGWAMGYEKEQAKDLAKTYVDLDNQIRKVDKDAEKLTKGLVDAQSKLNGLTDETVDNVKTGGAVVSNSTKKTTAETSKEFETRYKNLKRSLEREKITHADYYKDLKNLRDEYFTQGSDEWQKYTEELAEFAEDTFDDCVDKLKEFKDEVHNKIQALKEEQEALKESLMPDKSPVEFGTINGEAYVSLANYDKELYQLERYGALLDELFEKRGDLPQSVLDEIKEMDTEQAMKYMSGLINSSDPQYNAFIQARQKLEEAASENSAKLMSAEAEEMKRILEEKFGELPEDFFELGDESASAFGDGFLNELSSAMETVRQTIMSEMSTISNAAVASFAASVGTGTTSVVHNNYNSTYTFNSSKDTTTQQLRAAQNAATLERLRGNT